MKTEIKFKCSLYGDIRKFYADILNQMNYKISQLIVLW